MPVDPDPYGMRQVGKVFILLTLTVTLSRQTVEFDGVFYFNDFEWTLRPDFLQKHPNLDLKTPFSSFEKQPLSLVFNASLEMSC